MLMKFERIVLPPIEASKGAVNEAKLLFSCLRIMFVCVSADPDQIDKKMELRYRSASFAYGSVLEHLQGLGFFSDRVFNLYYVYARVFLPMLYSKANAPKLVSTQYNEVQHPYLSFLSVLLSRLCHSLALSEAAAVSRHSGDLSGACCQPAIDVAIGTACWTSPSSSPPA